MQHGYCSAAAVDLSQKVVSVLSGRKVLDHLLLIQNRNLKRRIMQEHEGDVVLRVAATVAANARDGAQQSGPAAGGGGGSSESAPKRSRLSLSQGLIRLGGL